MLALHEKAESNSITAILGMGASPGLTNMLGATAIQELDETGHFILAGLWMVLRQRKNHPNLD